MLIKNSTTLAKAFFTNSTKEFLLGDTNKKQGRN
jgi:hypothetical protein|nr:MAG TPA: hypothetical protein [Caudoviricetes sp.]